MNQKKTNRLPVNKTLEALKQDIKREKDPQG